MFDFTALRDIEHITEWTGLSAGALCGCAAIAYFGWSIPAARRLAIAGALAVGCLYGGELHGNTAGRADVMAEWNAAKAKAAAEAKARDDRVATDLEAKYAPLIAANAVADKSGDKNATQAVASIAAGSCQLGAGALRLRVVAKPK